MQNKFLPKIKSKMKELGLQEKKSSNWEIHIKLLKNSSDKQSSGLLLVSSELKNENKTHGNKFLVNLTMNEDQLSQKILLALRSHIPTSFTVVKNSQQWKAEMKSDDPLFWQLRKGTPLINSIGKHFVVGSNVKNKNSFQLHALNSSSPCLDQEDSCLLYSKTVPEYSPWPGAIKLKIKLTQKNQFHDSNLNSRDVYVSGFLAKNLAPHVYSYWGRPGEKVFVTVIHRDQIVYREEIVSKKEQLPVIALDQLSKKKI